MNPEITVAIPFTGCDIEPFKLAVRSVYSQTMVEWDLILIADGADEPLVELACRIQDPRVTVEIHRERAGLAARLNESARLARTEYLVRMDADDVMMRSRLAVQLASLKRRAAEVVAGGAIAVDEDLAILGRMRESSLPTSGAGYLRSDVVIHPTVAAATEWFRRNPYREDVRRAEDKELWLRTFSRATATLHRCADPVLFYRTPRGVNRKKSLSTIADDRLVSRPYMPLVRNPVRRTRAEVEWFLKSIAYSRGPATLLERVSKRRSTLLTESESRSYEAELRLIGEMDVPGWGPCV